MIETSLNEECLLNIGPVDCSHSAKLCGSHFERICQMWAMRLCMQREVAWFEDALYPGVLSNEGCTAQDFAMLPVALKNRIVEIVREENRLVLRYASESSSLAEAVDRLIKICRRLTSRMTYPETVALNDMIDDTLKWAAGGGQGI